MSKPKDETIGGLAVDGDWFAALIESLPFDFWAVDRDGRFAAQNSTCREHWGDVIGSRPVDVAPDPETGARWTGFVERAFAGETIRGDVAYRRHSETRNYFYSISPVRNGDRVIGATGVNLDITREKRHADELERRHKIESLGVLAGGIAHDFNNLLMGIRGMISLAARHLEPEAPPSKLLGQAERGCVNAERLSRRLLTFAQGGKPVCAPTEIGPVVEDAVRLAVTGSGVACRFELPDGLWWSNVDAGQIGQAFGNLALNAAQALLDGGTVRVAARNLCAAEAAALDLEQRGHVHVSIADDGPGIPEEHLPHVFEPFFTTKETGRGLGLAIVYSVVNRHQGTVRVDSSPGHGTRFDVFLPSVETCCDEPDPGLVQFSGRALVVEDDPLVRNAVAGMLDALGLEVTTANDCDQALAAYRSGLNSDRPFRVVILDLTLRGGIGGDTCFGLLRDIDPAVRAIVTSGYATNPILADYASHGYAAALPKPFSFEQLLDALGRAILPESAH